MRKLLLLAWLMLPVLGAAYHYGPGQERLLLDDAAGLLSRAAEHADAEEWAEAEKAYTEALELLPADQVTAVRSARLERAKAQMFVKKLPVAHRDLRGLVDELAEDPDADPRLLDGAREAQANAQYYMTWLLRLEGHPEERWKPEIEAARQTYRLLAERRLADGDEYEADKHREDLEAAIRLERMELSELQGLPLPSQ